MPDSSKIAKSRRESVSPAEMLESHHSAQVTVSPKSGTQFACYRGGTSYFTLVVAGSISQARGTLVIMQDRSGAAAKICGFHGLGLGNTYGVSRWRRVHS